MSQVDTPEGSSFSWTLCMCVCKGSQVVVRKEGKRIRRSRRRRGERERDGR
jgi:hypothetical protein